VKKSDAIIWILSIFSAIGTGHYFYTVLTPTSQEFSSQISSYLDLAHNDCKNLNNEQRTHLVQTLQSAEKALNIENNRSKARDLVNSVGGDLYLCSPKMELPQGGAELAAIMMTTLVTALGMRIILKKLWSKYDNKRKG
jgi:hypothetical protein